jgi:hypothetical protein
MTHRLSVVLLFCMLAATALTAVGQDREYTDYEKRRFELDKRFTADVLLDNGTRFHVNDFRIGTGIYRNVVSVGTQGGLLMPLSNITRIARSSEGDNWVDIVFLNGSRMHTRWSDPSTQLFHGILADGSPWEAGITDIREIDITEVAPDGADGGQ